MRALKISKNVAAAVVVVVLLTIATAACGSSGARTAAPAPTTLPPTTTTTTLPKAVPFDPTKPVNLAGTAGVTAAEQHRAEKLLRQTIADLPKYDDPSVAETAGYRSIGDALTGDEHYINWSYVNDGRILDANRPESLVYEMRDGKKTLAAAMYMLPFGSRFSDVPDVGGKLTQWHVHRDLCLTNDPLQKVLAGGAGLDQPCPAGTEKAGDTPMLHVWIVPNYCGPFAALEGIGAGQVPKGQTRLCDTAHGSVSS
jgi:hypothetical protein